MKLLRWAIAFFTLAAVSPSTLWASGYCDEHESARSCACIIEPSDPYCLGAATEPHHHVDTPLSHGDDFAVGSTVYDPDGGIVGTISGVDGDYVIVATDKVKFRIGRPSFAHGSSGLTLAKTAAFFNEAVLSSQKNDSNAAHASQNTLGDHSYRDHPELEASRCLSFHSPIDIDGERVTNSCSFPVAYTFCISNSKSAFACESSGSNIGKGSDTVGPHKTGLSGWLGVRGHVETYWHACRNGAIPEMRTKTLGACMSN